MNNNNNNNNNSNFTNDNNMTETFYLKKFLEKRNMSINYY